VELPAELLVKTLSTLTFSEICDLRLVSRRFNEICASMLSGAFQKLQNTMLQRFHNIKNKMPRRESARRYSIGRKKRFFSQGVGLYFTW
jgi:F-box protein 28